MPTVLAAAAHAAEDNACQILLYTGFLLWILAYLFIIGQCYIQKTYGVPWQSICLNITWEFFFAFVCPLWTPLQQASYCSGSTGFSLRLLQIWFALDVVILCQLLCYGRREQSGILRRYFAVIVPLCLFLAYFGQMTFVTYNTDDNGLELSWIINLVMSLLFVEMALSRPRLRGLSYPAAWLKMAGSLAMAVCVTRLGITSPRQGDALLVFLATSTLVADCFYIYLLTVGRKKILERRLESRIRDRKERGVTAALLVLLLFPVAVQAAGSRLEGRLSDAHGQGIGGATVLLRETGASTVTDDRGRYAFEGLAAGSCTLTFRLGERTAGATAMVAAEGTTPVETRVDWDLGFAETITVTAASRQVETLAAAPAAVSLVTGEEAARRPAHGQVPELLAFSPGADLTQSGLFDFNLNTRGFNTAVNPRVLTLIDGRDPSLPGIGSQEWAAVSFPVDELARMELVRGPGSALYGAGAYNGVLDLTTRSPKESLGGRARLTGGELGTRRLELRHAGRIGDGAWFKLLGGYQRSRDFTRPRTGSVEYAPGLLPGELIPPPRDEVEIAFGELRLDRELGRHTLALAAGTAQHRGIVTVADVGRSQQQDTARPWGRVRLSSPSWNVQAFYTGQEADDIRSLNSGEPLYLDSSRTGIDLQGDMGFLSKGRLLGGLSSSRETVDSADPQGRQTIFSKEEAADRRSAYGQAEYPFGDSLKAVLALRWDEGDLYDSRISPRGALAYSFSPRHTLRLSYSKGFQSPAFSQFFLRAPVAAPLDLSALEASLAPLLAGVPLGFRSIPILAVGNEDLEPGTISGLEMGYTGIFGRDLLVTVQTYRNRLSDFATNLLPQVGTSLGRLNPRFGPYAPPSALSPEAAAAVLAALRSALAPGLFASLSNDADGSPVLILLSEANAGRVDTRGLELSVSRSWRREWLLELNYSCFDFEIREQAPESPLTPNTPEHRLALGLTYTGERSSATLKYRRIQGFDWASGIFAGPVPSYGVIDLAANRELRKGWEVGLDVANLLDDDHYQIFGGDLLGRRALAYVSRSWS